MSLREQLIEVIGRLLRMSAHDDSVNADEMLDAVLDVLEEHDRKQRHMEWPFSFPEYLRLMRTGNDY